MMSGEYQKAQSLYLMARDMSVAAGNVGKNYIDSKLKLTKDYIDVFDLQAIYVRLELANLADGINGKIAAARAGIEAEKQAEEVQNPTQEPVNTEPETEEYGPGTVVQ